MKKTLAPTIMATALLTGCITIPLPTDPVDPGSGVTNSVPASYLCAGFLENDASSRNMNDLSINKSEDGVEITIARHKAFGFTQVLLSLANEGDGSPVPTSFYRDKWFGDIDPDKVAMMRRRIQKYKDAGFHVCLWGFLDDSKSLAKATPEQVMQFYRDCIRLFGDLADSWCLGLEIDEWGDSWWKVWHSPKRKLINEATALLKTTGKPVGPHFTSYKKIGLAVASGADVFYAQFGWLKKPSQMTAAMNWMNERKGNMKIVACEFNRDSTTPLATALANAAMNAGAVGTQTGKPDGVTPATVAKRSLLSYFGRTAVPSPAVSKKAAPVVDLIEKLRADLQPMTDKAKTDLQSITGATATATGLAKALEAQGIPAPLAKTVSKAAMAILGRVAQ